MSSENKTFFCGGQAKFYTVYKCSLALFLVAMFIYGIVHQLDHKPVGREDYWYTDYYSNWTEVTCTIWAVVHAYIAVSKEPPKAICSVAVTLSSLAFSNALILSVAYWGLIGPTEFVNFHVRSLHQHVFLAFITFLDLLVTQISLRWYHLLWTIVYGACYASNTVIAYALGRGCIYPFLDYNNHFNDALKFDLYLTVPIGTAVFVVSYGICRLKFCIRERLSPNSSYSHVPTGMETTSTLA